MQTICHACGTALPPGSRFCPKCGADVAPGLDTAETLPAYVPPDVTETPRVAPEAAPPSAAPVGAAAPATPRRFNTLALVAIALVVLAGLVLFMLIGMPFGGGDRDIERRQVETDTIGEAPVPPTQPSLGVNDTAARIEEIPTNVPPTDTALTDTTASLPPLTVPPPNVETAPPPVTPSAPPPTPRPVDTRPPAAVTETDAIAIVRGAAHAYYDGVTAECLGVTSEGFVNVGYTISVSDTCRGTTLGRWRVDARNGEVFRQREDGRYLKP